MSTYTKSFIELRMNGIIKNEEWLKIKFESLHRYLQDDWDEEQLEKISLLKCICIDDYRNEKYDLYSGIYSDYTWDNIKNKMLSNELYNVNLLP